MMKRTHYAGATALAAALLILVACNSSNGGGTPGEPTVRPAVVLYGDSRTGNDVHTQLFERMITHAPVMIFHAGDMVTDGNCFCMTPLPAADVKITATSLGDLFM